MDKSDLVKFRSECIAAHNFYRSLHGTTPLVWSTRLADGAQKWAEQLASADSLTYSQERGVGENIACLWGSDVTGNKVTQIWYEESQNYDYSAPRVTPNNRPFCQVVWEGCRELGAGKAATKNGKQVVVARYHPPVSRKQAEKNVKLPKLDRIDGSTALATRPSVGLRKFQEECLFAHNEFRVLHGAPPLHWSPSLAWAAQQWAEKLAEIGELKHNNDELVGENLAGMVGDELTGKECTDMWYEEVKDFDFENPCYSEETSNFTQVVWIGSELFGVGRANLGDTCIVVAFYEPPGNIEGLFGSNVRLQGTKVKTYRLTKEMKTFIPPSPDLDWFRIECLVAHNYFRARHGAPPLVIGQALNEEAQYWAERLLVTGATEDLQESRIGINVAIIHGHHVSGLKVTELWYDEGTGYNFESPGFSLSTRSFTQLIWLSSRKLGIGKATNNSGQCVIVARYEPVGNIDGLFVTNVRRRGHERNALEPMIFESDVKYRFKVEGRRSFRMSWEIEGTQTLQAVDKARDKTRRKEQAQPAYLSSPETFTRLVWIESPVLPRKQMRESCDLEMERSDEDKESGVEEGEEFEQEEPSFIVVHPIAEAAAARKQCERAIVYTEPQRTDRYPDVRRSLSLDSEGTEPEPEEGHVLSRVAYFQHFEKIEKEKLDRPKRSSIELKEQLRHNQFGNEEEKSHKISEHEENVCQLEYDDVFPKHDENDERDDDFASEGEAEDDDDDVMSLETVSEAGEELLEELDEYEMDHHIKSYCYEVNYPREEDERNINQDETTDERGQIAEIIETELDKMDKEQVSQDPDHCVASSADRDDSVKDQMRVVDTHIEFVPIQVEKRRTDFNPDDVIFNETEEEKELFKSEIKTPEKEKPSLPLCTESVNSEKRDRLECELNVDEMFSRLDKPEKPKEKPPPTLPKPKRKLKEVPSEARTEIIRTVETTQTMKTTVHRKTEPESVPVQREETVHTFTEVTEEKPTEQKPMEATVHRKTEPESVPVQREETVQTFKEVTEEKPTEQKPMETTVHRKTEPESFPVQREETVHTFKEVKEEKPTEQKPMEAESKQQSEEEEEEEALDSDEEAMEVFDLSFIDRERKLNNIFKRLGRRMELIPTETKTAPREFDRNIDLSDTKEEEEWFRSLYVAPVVEKKWKKSPAQEETIFAEHRKRDVESEIDFEELFERLEKGEETPSKEAVLEPSQDLVVLESERVEEEPQEEKPKVVRFDKTVIVQEHETVYKDFVELKESVEDHEDHGEEYEEVDHTRTEELQQITPAPPVYLAHECEEPGEFSADTSDQEEEEAESYGEEEEVRTSVSPIDNEETTVQFSEELSERNNSYGTCEVDTIEPSDSVADVYEEYEPTPVTHVSETSCSRPIHVAADVDNKPLESGVEDESVRTSMYESFEEVLPEASASSVIEPSTCYVAAEINHRATKVEPVEEDVEVAVLSSDEEPETIDKIAVHGIPESTESTVCITTETTFHHRTEIVQKRAPSIEMEMPLEKEEEEPSYKEILPNGHCTSVHISHDIDERKTEIITETESYETEISQTLEEDKNAVSEVQSDLEIPSNISVQLQQEEEEKVEETVEEEEEEVKQLEEAVPATEDVEETVEEREEEKEEETVDGKQEEEFEQPEEAVPVTEDVEETVEEREEEKEEETVEEEQEEVEQLEEVVPVTEDVEETVEEREEEKEEETVDGEQEEEEVEQPEEAVPVTEDVEETVEEREEEKEEETVEEEQEEVEQLEEAVPVTEDVEETVEEREEEKEEETVEEEEEEEAEQLEEAVPVTEDVEETVEEREEEKEEETVEEEQEEEVEQLEEAVPVTEDVEETVEEREEEKEEETVEEEEEEEAEQLEEAVPVTEDMEETVEEREEEKEEETVEEEEEEEAEQLEEAVPVTEDVEETVEEREEEKEEETVDGEQEEEVEQPEEAVPATEDVEETVEEREEEKEEETVEEEEEKEVEQPEEAVPATEDVEETVEEREEEKEEETVEKEQEEIEQLEEAVPVTEDVEETVEEREEEKEEETVEEEQEEIEQLEEAVPVTEDVEETVEEREEEKEEETVEEEQEEVEQLEEAVPVTEDVEETVEGREEEKEEETVDGKQEEEFEQPEEAVPVTEDVEETVEEREEEKEEETVEEEQEEVEQLEEAVPVTEDVEETVEEREEEKEEETVEEEQEEVEQLEEAVPVTEDVEETVEEREEEKEEETVDGKQEEEFEQPEEAVPVTEDVEETVEEREEEKEEETVEEEQEEAEQLEEAVPVTEDVEETVEEREEEKVEETIEQAAEDKQEAEFPDGSEEKETEEREQVEETQKVVVIEKSQTLAVDDRFEYISEEELEETEELYEALRESFEEQDNEELIDEENVHVQQTAAGIIHISSQEEENYEAFVEEQSEDEITYDSEVITEVEKEITSALVVKESFSSAVCEDETANENIDVEERKTESPVEETQPEALLQFSEPVDENVSEEDADDVDEREPDASHDDVFLTEEQIEPSETPEVEECEELESSDEIIDKKVELIQFTEEITEEEKLASEDEEVFEEEKSVSESEERPPTPDEEEEGDNLDSSEEFAEENVELIQFDEQVDEDKVIDQSSEVDEPYPLSPDVIEEKQIVTESGVELIQFTEHVEEERVEEGEQLEQVESEDQKDEEQITDEKTELIQFVEHTEEIESTPNGQAEELLEEYVTEDSGKVEVEEELMISQPIACSTPIFLDENEQTEETTSFEDSAEAGFGEGYEDMEKIVAHDHSLDVSQPVSLEESSDMSNEFYKAEAEEAASKAMAEEFDDSGKIEAELENLEEEEEKEQTSVTSSSVVTTTVYEKRIIKTEHTEREFVGFTPLESADGMLHEESREDHLSPPPTITATEFVADEEEEGSEEEYIPNFEHPRTYMMESKEVVMDRNALESKVVEQEESAPEKEEHEEPAVGIQAPSEMETKTEVVESEPGKVETETTTVTVSHRSEVVRNQESDIDDLEEKELEERIQRKQKAMEENLLQDEIKDDISDKDDDIPDKRTTESEESRTELFFTSISVVKVEHEDDEQRIFREEEATIMMLEDELKLEENESSTEELDVMKEDEALTEAAFRAERQEEERKTEDSSDEPDRGQRADDVAQVPIIPLMAASDVVYKTSKSDKEIHEEVDYQEEVEVERIESSFTEEEEPKTHPVVLTDVDFTEEIEVEKVQEEPEEEEEEDGTEDVYEEEVEIQRVENQEEGFKLEYPDDEVFEEEVIIERIEEEHEEEQESSPDVASLPVYEEELEVAAAEQIPPQQPVAAEENIVHAEQLHEDAGENNEVEQVQEEEQLHEDAGENNEVEQVQEQEQLHEVAGENNEVIQVQEQEQLHEDAGEDNEVEQVQEEEQAWEEYEEMEEQDQEIPQEIQGIADQSDMHLYDNNNNESLPRYYVDFSPGGSFERESTTSDDGEGPGVYRQGEPMEEDMEEFILVKYEDQSSSSGEDISDHREMYVIHEEDTEDRADEKKGATNVSQEEKVAFEQGFVNPALEDIREEDEEEKQKHQKEEGEDVDFEEKRQLAEYERLESFVILEEKLSQVESDESVEDLTSGTDGKRASSEETLNDEDELSETMTSSTLKDETTSKDDASGDEVSSPESQEPSALDTTLTKEIEEETIDLEDGGVLSKRTVREESYSIEEDDGDDEDKDKTLTRKKVSKRVVTTTSTSETHVKRIESVDNPSPTGSDNESEPQEEREEDVTTIDPEEQPEKQSSRDEESSKEAEESPEFGNKRIETEEEIIDLDDGGVVKKFVTREETYTVDEGNGDGEDDQDSSISRKTVTKKIVTTTTTSTSKVTRLGDEPSSSFSDDDANRVVETSSEETHTTIIKSRQPEEPPATAKRQLSLENSGASSEACAADSSRKRRGYIKRFDSHDSEGHSSEVSSTTDSTGDSTSISSEGHVSDEDFSGLDEFQIDCIRQHNIYRHRHRACRLLWSEDLAAGAAEWADHLAATKTLEHSPQKECGENLACAKGYDLRGDKVADMWYEEIKDYNFETPAFNAKCGHFTQTIWRATKEFGVAKSIADDGSQYVVARYNPPGNVLGEFKDSIRRSRGQKTSVRKRRRSSSRRQLSHSSDMSDVLSREKFKNECVISHNYYRSLHGAPTLQWSTMLATEAQNFAEKLTKSGSFMHSESKEIGECLAFSFGLDLSGRDAVDTWYDEIVDYDYEYPGYTSHTANFTQVVWAGSKEFGMGKAIGDDGSCVVVGRYYPPGNIVGDFQENVKQKGTGYY